MTPLPAMVLSGISTEQPAEPQASLLEGNKLNYTPQKIIYNIYIY